MKIKIVETGWAGYTGHLGHVEFADGVSVDEVNKADAQFIASIVAVEQIDAATGEGTGKSPGIAQHIIDNGAKAAVVDRMQTAEEAGTPAVAPAKVYTADELAAIADDKGIAGIREIADPLNLKGKSIAELIGKVLTAQSEAQAKADAAKPVVGGPIDPPAAE